jgi:hypothetical protein
MNRVGERLRRDPNVLVLGGAVALATIIVGTALAVYVSADPSPRGGGVDVAAAGATERSSTTTTTGPAGATTTSTAAGSGGTLPSTGGGSGQAGGAAPVPRETTDPEDPPYIPQPLPAGVRATLDLCTWSPVNGGELQAAGTITWLGPEEDSWDVDVYWLQNDRELDTDWTDVTIDMLPGQTSPWRVTINGHPDPPADPFRCAIEVF